MELVVFDITFISEHVPSHNTKDFMYIHNVQLTTLLSLWEDTMNGKTMSTVNSSGAKSLISLPPM